jgi:hypothetical protein
MLQCCRWMGDVRATQVILSEIFCFHNPQVKGHLPSFRELFHFAHNGEIKRARDDGYYDSVQRENGENMPPDASNGSLLLLLILNLAGIVVA